MTTFTEVQLRELMVLIHRKLNNLKPDDTPEPLKNVKQRYNRNDIKRDTRSQFMEWVAHG